MGLEQVQRESRDRLEKENKALKAQLKAHEWIPVTPETMPEIPQEDMCCSELVLTTTGDIDGTVVQYYNYESHSWQGEIENPTYWKPITLPKGE